MSLDNQLIQLVNDAIFANPDKDVSQDLLQVKSLGHLIKFSSVDLAATDNDKVTLLHKFAFHRYYQSATFLISHGASASLKDGKGRTTSLRLVNMRRRMPRRRRIGVRRIRTRRNLERKT